MKSIRTAGTALVVASTLAGTALAQAPAPAAPGWTGASNPQDVITARRALMLEVEQQMRAIDTSTVDDAVDPAEVTAAARAVAPMLAAVPHLFPPTTNLYDPKDQAPPTLALSEIWTNFPAFYRMAAASAATATSLAEAQTAERRRAGSIALRATCDACHAQYMKPYERGGATQDDKNFDFDSIFKNE